MPVRFIVLAIILLPGMFWSAWARKLTVAGAITGGITGQAVFMGAGFTGLIMMTLFFLLGTLATSWKRARKESLGVAESRQGRTAWQVLANAGAAGLLGLCGWMWPGNHHFFTYLMAAAFSSAAADTISSELGNVYGSRYYNILTFKKDLRGLNGVVSTEGTLLGMAASAVVAAVYATGFDWNRWFACIVAAGTIGNLADSVMGATLERRHQLNNDAVNFLNTVLAVLAAWGMYVLLG